MTLVKERFLLSPETTHELRSMKANFGFNGLGEVVFRRTYSRGDEDWGDVVIRVIQGVMSIRKDHFIKNKLDWDDEEWQPYAKSMAIAMFQMEWLPPGRGLWMMGTDFAYERGNMALTNCSATDTRGDLVHSAEWAMDCLMNGVGVGFTTYWRGSITPPNKEDREIFQIPDSREGWVESLIKMLCAYIPSRRYPPNKFPEFDYSKVRPAGEPIKGFGGLASGPAPLQKLHTRLEGYLDAFCKGRLQCSGKTWKELPKEDGEGTEWREVDVEVDKEYGHTRLITDIFNAIGACVVAGNVRRSAEICLGSVDDPDFIHLKNYEMHPERSEVGWMSNNSVVLGADQDYEDFTHIPDMARRIRDNGEPGLINLYNIQKYGRYGKEMPDTATLTNPCVTGDTWIMTACGSHQVRDLIGIPYNAIVNGKSYECKTGFFSTGIKPVYKLATSEGFMLRATSNHKLLTANGEWVELGELIEGDKLSIHDHGSFSLGNCNEYSNTDDFCRGWLLGSLFGDGTFNYRENKALLCYWGETRYEMTTLALEYLSRLGYEVTDNGGYDYIKYDKNIITSRGLFEVADQYIKKGKILTDQVEKESLAFQAGFLRGWFDADGSVQGSREKGVSVRLTSVSLNELKRAQRMALRLGVYGKIYLERHPAGDRLLPDGHGGMKMYSCKTTHELIISRSSLEIYSTRIGFSEIQKDTKLRDILSSYQRKLYGVRFEATVKTIVKDGEEEVFDCTVEDVHAFDANGIYAHNCAEISLSAARDKDGNITGGGETCNLAEVFPPRCADKDVFYQALRYATYYSSTVALLPSHRPETNAIVAKNRRIGISISGIAQWASGEVPEGWGDMNYTKMTTQLRNAYKVVRQENTALAERAGVPASIRVTTIKPSGSISLLAGVTPGVHYPVSRYAIRRMRIGEDSPLVPSLQEAGIPHEKDTYSDNTLVFEFAIDHGNVRSVEEVSPWEQLALAAMLQRVYVDNSVSNTIYFDKEKDGPDVEKMLAMYIPVLKTISMLPHAGHGYAQAPYEPINREKYLELRDSYKLPDFSKMGGAVPSGSVFCSGDTCEFVPPSKIQKTE